MMDKNTLKNSFLGLYTEMEESPMSKEDFASRMADIIDGYIRTAELDNASGRYVAGTLIAGAYPVLPVPPGIAAEVNVTGGLK